MCGRVTAPPLMERATGKTSTGLWEYAIVGADSPQAPGEYFKGEILVPFAVESAPVGVGKSLARNRSLWYRPLSFRPLHWKRSAVSVEISELLNWEAEVVVQRELK